MNLDSFPVQNDIAPVNSLQCHRKITYQQCNAPAEQPEPKGIFWFGTQFETEIAIPFLRYAADCD